MSHIAFYCEFVIRLINIRKLQFEKLHLKSFFCKINDVIKFTILLTPINIACLLNGVGFGGPELFGQQSQFGMGKSMNAENFEFLHSD